MGFNTYRDVGEVIRHAAPARTGGGRGKSRELSLNGWKLQIYGGVAWRSRKICGTFAVDQSFCNGLKADAFSLI